MVVTRGALLRSRRGCKRAGCALQRQVPDCEQSFDEAVALMGGGCRRCTWAAARREAVALQSIYNTGRGAVEHPNASPALKFLRLMFRAGLATIQTDDH